MKQGQLALETVLKFLVEENEGDISLFYPEDYIKRLQFLKENIDTQIDRLILKEETNAI